MFDVKKKKSIFDSIILKKRHKGYIRIMIILAFLKVSPVSSYDITNNNICKRQDYWDTQINVITVCQPFAWTEWSVFLSLNGVIYI